MSGIPTYKMAELNLIFSTGKDEPFAMDPLDRRFVVPDRGSLKKVGRRKAGTWGRTHGPSRGDTKRIANKAVRKMGRSG